MTLTQFNKLKEVDQFTVLLSHGTIIAKRKEGRHRYVLYQLDRIYIELKYHKDFKTMPDVRGFTSSGKSLLPYLEKIDLSELLLQ